MESEHTVYVTFNINASSQRRAEQRVKRILNPNTQQRQEQWSKWGARAVIFSNPAMDKLLTDLEEE